MSCPPQYGANESHVDGQNRTPLHWAGECWGSPNQAGMGGVALKAYMGEAHLAPPKTAIPLC